MSGFTRRGFLSTLAAGAAASGVTAVSPSWAAPPSERFRVAVIGCGNQGQVHFRSLAAVSEAQIVAVCDVDEERLGKAAELTGAKPVSDLRRILDDPSIDGVTIVVPDHWHVPAALLALEAGKHVYLEKPCSHNFREGQMILSATQKSDRVVQHGSQSRSSVGFQQAIGLLREGIIGEVLAAKCWNWQTRTSIGHATPSDPPAGVDYDTWVGPAVWLPYQRNRFHYEWHWWYNFGSGDMGNDGIHELDYTLWGLGITTAPRRVSGSGGVYFFDDDRQWPDTQQVTLEYDTPQGPRMAIYEQRLWSNSYPYNVDSGAEFYGTKGKIFLSKRGKFEVFDDKKQRVPTRLDGPIKPVIADHMRNWIESAKSGKRPNAPLEVAHTTATAVHLGNISTRLHKSLVFDAAQGKIVDDTEANALLGREYRAEGHWAIPRLG